MMAFGRVTNVKSAKSGESHWLEPYGAGEALLLSRGVRSPIVDSERLAARSTILAPIGH